MLLSFYLGLCFSLYEYIVTLFSVLLVTLHFIHTISYYPTRPCLKFMTPLLIPVGVSLCVLVLCDLPFSLLWPSLLWMVRIPMGSRSRPRSTRQIVLASSHHLSMRRFWSLKQDNSAHFQWFVRRRGSCSWITWKQALHWMTSSAMIVVFGALDLSLNSPWALSQHFTEKSSFVSLLHEWILLSSIPGSESLPLTVSTQTLFGDSSFPSVHCLASLLLPSLICLLPTLTVRRRNAPLNLVRNYMLSYTHFCVMCYNHS